MQFEPPLVAGTCPFCAANIVTQPKDSDPLIAPDGVLPFAVVKEQAADGSFHVTRSDIYGGGIVNFVPFTKLDNGAIKGTHSN